jgi:hypothetical protein
VATLLEALKCLKAWWDNSLAKRVYNTYSKSILHSSPISLCSQKGISRLGRSLPGRLGSACLGLSVEITASHCVCYFTLCLLVGAAVSHKVTTFDCEDEMEEKGSKPIPSYGKNYSTFVLNEHPHGLPVKDYNGREG